MWVRPCTWDDLPALARDLPDRRAEVHRRHLQRQEAGERTYLGAFDAGQVLGTGVMSWVGCREAEPRERFPEAVEIAGLQVVGTVRGRTCATD